MIGVGHRIIGQRGRNRVVGHVGQRIGDRVRQAAAAIPHAAELVGVQPAASRPGRCAPARHWGSAPPCTSRSPGVVVEIGADLDDVVADERHRLVCRAGHSAAQTFSHTAGRRGSCRAQSRVARADRGQHAFARVSGMQGSFESGETVILSGLIPVVFGVRQRSILSCRTRPFAGFAPECASRGQPAQGDNSDFCSIVNQAGVRIGSTGHAGRRNASRALPGAVHVAASRPPCGAASYPRIAPR